MFDIHPTELLVLGTVALLVIPPKDLPKALRFAGQWVGRARSIARQFRSGLDEMIRESELAEMEKRWAAENERIMREHPPGPAMLPMIDAVTPEMHDEQAAPDIVEPPVIVDAPVLPPPDVARS